MRYDGRARLGGALLAGLMMALLAGCSGDTSGRRLEMEQLPARRLVGVWDATFWLEHPVTLTVPVRQPPKSISGALALIEDPEGKPSSDELPDPTHVGVFSLDLSAFGIQLRDVGDLPVVVARTTPAAGGAGGSDSVLMVLNPGSARFPFRLAGVFRGDSLAGTWTAGQSLGGGGRFVLRRHQTPR